MSLAIIMTGGTFCKEYCPSIQGMDFNLPKVKRLIENLPITEKVEIEIWHKFKDSAHFTEEDRLDLFEFCKSFGEEIVIIHGTDTMSNSAEFFLKHFNLISDKTIVFTGAFIPVLFPDSDGIFNLGFAIACAKLNKCGVYVAMNGKCFDGGNVRKNFKKGIFEEK